MHRRMTAEFVDLSGRVRRAAEEGVRLEMVFDISRLFSVSKMSGDSRRTTTDVDIVQYGHNKDVQRRVPPANNDAGTIRLADVRRPKHSHQPIMLYHDQRRYAAKELDSERTPPPQLLSRRDAGSGSTRVLQTIVSARCPSNFQQAVSIPEKLLWSLVAGSVGKR